MSTDTLNTKFQLRRDTYTHWHTANPQLADGEPILIKENGIYKLKIGDGNTYFDNLPYYSGGAEKFVVTLTQDAQTEVLTADKTVAEIVAANAAGKIVECVAPIESGVNLILHHVAIGNPEGVNVVVFNATADDDNKPMTVVVSGINAGSEDVWDFDSYSLDSAPFIVTLTKDEQTEEWTADKTYAQIVAARQAGRICECVVPVQNGVTMTLHDVVDAHVGGVNVAGFSATTDDDGALLTGIVSCINTNDGDVWEVMSIPIPNIPEYSSSNNGQVLGLSSNSLAWVDNYAPLIVTLTEENDTWTADKTIAEIIEAHEANQVVVAKYSYEG